MITRLLSILVCSCLLVSCSSYDNTRYDGESAAYIYAHGHNDLADGDYNDAIKAFESLNSQYPFSEYSRKGDLEIIYAYYLADQSALAMAAAQRFLKLYPNDPEADYAYYMLGVVEFDNGRGFLQRYFPYQMDKHKTENYNAAYHHFEMIVKEYPKSRYAEDARRRMMYLMNIMADYQYLIGHYYYKRGAYVASLERAKAVLIQYPRSPLTEKALILSIKAYKNLGLYDLARSTNDVLKLNYPETKYNFTLPADAENRG